MQPLKATKVDWFEDDELKELGVDLQKQDETIAILEAKNV